MARNHWTILGEIDPALNDKITAWRTHLLADEETLPRKYRELINVAMGCLTRIEPIILAHAKLAHQHGATKREIVAAVAQALTMGGNPAFRAGMLALDAFLQEID